MPCQRSQAVGRGAVACNFSGRAGRCQVAPPPYLHPTPHKATVRPHIGQFRFDRSAWAPQRSKGGSLPMRPLALTLLAGLLLGLASAIAAGRSPWCGGDRRPAAACSNLTHPPLPPCAPRAAPTSAPAPMASDPWGSPSADYLTLSEALDLVRSCSLLRSAADRSKAPSPPSPSAAP